MLFSYYHSWIIATLGIITSSFLYFRNIQKDNSFSPTSLAIIISTIYLALFSGRIFYLFSIDPQVIYKNPEYLLDLWKNNGIFILVPLFLLIASAIIHLIQRRSLLSNLGSIAPSIALLHVFFLLILHINEHFTGAPSSLPWSTYSNLLQRTVHPVALYLLIFEILTFLLLQKMWESPENRKFLLPTYGALLSLSRFIIEFFNGGNPGIFHFFGLNSSQNFSIITFIIFTIILIVLLKRYILLLIPSTILVLLTSMFIHSFYFIDKTHKPILPKGQYFILTREVFSTEVSKLVQIKEKEGFNVFIKIWEKYPGIKDIKTWIKNNINYDITNSYILIIGDSTVEEEKTFTWNIPSIKYKINNTEFFTDRLFGEFNDKNIPLIPVGRLPFRNIQQLKKWLVKIQKYKEQKLFPLQNKLFCWYNDNELPGISKSFSNSIPDDMSLFILSPGNDSSKKIKIEKHDDVFLKQINFPYLITMIASHGSYKSITPYKSNSDITISVIDIEKQRFLEPGGLMIFLSCDTGNFALPINKGKSLAEALFLQYRGPAGIIAASEKTSPITNYFFAKFLFKQLDKNKFTIGHLLMSIQRDISKISKKIITTDQNVSFLKNLYSETTSKEIIFKDFLKYNILGDPSLTLKIYK